MHRLEGAAAVEGFQHAGEDESGQPHREGQRGLAEGAQIVAEVQREWVHEEEKENGLPYVAAHGALAQRRKGPQHCGQWRAGRKPLLHRLQQQGEATGMRIRTALVTASTAGFSRAATTASTG